MREANVVHYPHDLETQYDAFTSTPKPEKVLYLPSSARSNSNGAGKCAVAGGLVWTSLADILATPPAHWLIEGILAAGSVNLLYGSPKAGKTMFILGMLKAASAGEAFLGFPLEQMASWLISEQSENSLAPQLRTLRKLTTPRKRSRMRSTRSTSKPKRGPRFL